MYQTIPTLYAYVFINMIPWIYTKQTEKNPNIMVLFGFFQYYNYASLSNQCMIKRFMQSIS